MAERPTLASFLADACTPRNLIEQGSNYATYRLGDAAEWSPYILRVRRQVTSNDFNSKLMQASALYTPERLVDDLQVGQPLFESRTNSKWHFSIHQREDGHSIASGLDEREAFPEATLGFRTMQRLLARSRAGDDPFLEPVETIYRLLRDGYPTDAHWRNVLIDAQAKLTLVDQLEEPQPARTHAQAAALMPAAMTQFKFAITQADIGMLQTDRGDLMPDYKECIEQTNHAIDAAANAVISRHAQRQHTPCFRKVHEHKVALTDAPHVLLQQLRALDRRHAPTALSA